MQSFENCNKENIQEQFLIEATIHKLSFSHLWECPFAFAQAISYLQLICLNCQKPRQTSNNVDFDVRDGHLVSCVCVAILTALTRHTMAVIHSQLIGSWWFKASCRVSFDLTIFEKNQQQQKKNNNKKKKKNQRKSNSKANNESDK